MDRSIDSLGKVAGLLTLESDSGNWKTKIKNDDGNEMGFSLHHELYRFVLLPFELQKALSTFHETIHIAFLAAK